MFVVPGLGDCCREGDTCWGWHIHGRPFCLCVFPQGLLRNAEFWKLAAVDSVMHHVCRLCLSSVTTARVQHLLVIYALLPLHALLEVLPGVVARGGEAPALKGSDANSLGLALCSSCLHSGRGFGSSPAEQWWYTFHGFWARCCECLPVQAFPDLLARGAWGEAEKECESVSPDGILC